MKEEFRSRRGGWREPAAAIPGPSDATGWSAKSRSDGLGPEVAPGFFDLGDLFSVFWNGRLIIAACMVLGVCVGAVFLRFATPMYTSFSKVMLDPRERAVLSGEEVVSQAPVTDAVIASELAVLTSTTLISDVIDRLDVPSNPEFASLFESDGDTAAVPSEKQLFDAVRGRFSIRQQGISHVINIAFTAADPQLAADAANALAEAYLDYQRRDLLTSTQNASGWLQGQVDQLRIEVEAIEQDLLQQRSADLSQDWGDQAVVSQELAALAGELSLARAERVQVEARYAQLAQLRFDSDVMALVGTLDTPIFENLRERYSELQRERMRQLETFGADSSGIPPIDAELARLEASLETEVNSYVRKVEGEVEVARAREASLERSIRQIEQRMLSVATGAIDSNLLERRAEAAREVYQSLLVRLNETRAQEAVVSSNARIISEALVPDTPSAPREKLVLAALGFGGLAIGLIIVLLREVLSSGFRRLSDIEAQLGMAVTATIPWASPRQKEGMLRELVVNRNSVAAEQTRAICIPLINHRGVLGTTVAVNSALHAEGKTTTAIALCYTLSLAHKDVLLVDLDMRIPGVSQSLMSDTGKDLADILQGKAAPEEAILHDSVLGFDLLGCRGPYDGTLAVELLTEDRLRAFLDPLRSKYDVIILDTPPLLQAPEAGIVARVAESSIFLVRWSETPRSSARRAMNRIVDAGGRVGALVVTMAKPKFSKESDFSVPYGRKIRA